MSSTAACVAAVYKTPHRRATASEKAVSKRRGKGSPAGDLSDPAPSVTSSSLDVALQVLANNRKVVESKESLTGYHTTYEPTALAAAKSLFGGGKVYSFLGVNVGAVAASTSAVLLTTVANNLSSFLEGTSLSALFDEVRSISVKLHMVPGVFSGAAPAPFVIGYNSLAQGTTTPPTSATQVARLERSTLHEMQSGSTCSPGYVTVRSPPRKTPHPYCDTGTQYTLSPPSGTLGGFWIAQLGTVVANSVIFYYKVECELQLRMRA